jgi:uncharacterized protein YdiU (UPF0061 family)
MPSGKAGWNLTSTYTDLPEPFYVRHKPQPVARPEMVIFNEKLAESLDFDAQELQEAASAEIFAGNTLPPGADPIAQAYAGHQFGTLNQLGDGRAILLGEQLTSRGDRFDIQLKGAGQTPFSRRGDGRAALGPMLREYLVSEAMAALGIPTTRSLAVVSTGETVYRERPRPGAILTRVASSHLRVGTFVYAAHSSSQSAPLVKALADYAIARHYPHLAALSQPYLAFLNEVIERQARLVALWMQVGFIHGVLNTDNVSISGETIDYGPCAFLDRTSSQKVFSSIDRQGRYAFGNQPQITSWNLARFAETLLPLIAPSQEEAIELATKAVQGFSDQYHQHHLRGMRSKLGLFSPEARREPQIEASLEEHDAQLIADLLQWMESEGADFTLTFRALSDDHAHDSIFQKDSIQGWLTRWWKRLDQEPLPRPKILARMRSANPAIIARNHRVEEALRAATQNSDLLPLNQFLAALRDPFSESAGSSVYAAPPLNEDPDYYTTCGT